MQPIYLKRDVDRRAKRGHPWIFSNEIDVDRSPLKGAEPGALVRICDARGAHVGIAHLSPASLIAARLLTRAEDLPEDWLAARIARALAFRSRCFTTPHYRCVYGEGDALPGLVVDRYDDAVVVQTSTWGMERALPAVLAALDAELGPRSVVVKNDAQGREVEGLPAYVEVRRGSSDATVVERDARFAVELAAGQKTGWFFDQRDNRSRFDALYRDARVLDLYSYVGAWSVLAAKRGATRVVAVDSSEAAVASVRRNAELNRVERTIEAHKSDALHYLEHAPARGEVAFDIVIVDPPALVRRRKDLSAGRALYRRVNGLALARVAPGGLLITCSCSSALDADTHLADLRAAARHAHREIALVGRGGLPADHPVHPWLPESDYLKCVFVRVGSSASPASIASRPA